MWVATGKGENMLPIKKGRSLHSHTHAHEHAHTYTANEIYSLKSLAQRIS